MRFSNKRGRPKKIKERIDFGTEELQNKKKYWAFNSPLNFLKTKYLIDEIEYEYALKFRYLYKMKFGNPNIITAIDNIKTNGINRFHINTDKQNKMEYLYNQISKKLQKRKLKEIILDICVFDNKNTLPKIKSNNYLTKIKKGLKIIQLEYL